MESPSTEFVAEFSATWDPMEEVPHDAIDRILLDAEQVKKFPRPIEPHGVAGVEPEAEENPAHTGTKANDTSLPWFTTTKKWDARTMKKIRALEKVGLGSFDLCFIQNNYKNRETMEAYLAGMKTEQRELCVTMRKAMMTAGNQRDLRRRKELEIKELEQKYEEKRVKLEVERAYEQHLKERLGVAKREKCDALLAFCELCRAEGVNIPEWVKNM